jgi:predicted RNase H-like nuclease (RuvC/YqgF family)
MEERKPQLEDELEQFRTKEEFTNFMKKYFEIKQEEVDSLNTELANVRETLQAKIDELIYAYDLELSLRLQIDRMQHGENSENPNQVRN